MDQFNDIPWKVIDMYFRDNPSALIDHHLVSYNDFFNTGIKQLLKEKNPIRFIKDQHEETKEFQYQAYIYMGGKNADRIYYGKPIIYDDNDQEHIMYPNEARLRNMTYAFTIHVDLEIEFQIKVYDEIGKVKFETIKTVEIPKIFLGKFPIMLQSDMCILKNLTPEVRFNMGECRNDKGGYFIVDGKEKVIICQEKFADNQLYIQDNVSDVYSYSAKIRSVSEDASKPIRTLAVRMAAPQPSSSNGQIVVSIPNVRKPVPLFIVMRALGVISDKDIIKYCIFDIDKYSNILDIFRPSIHDAGMIFTQQSALSYIASLTKGKSNSHAMEILMMYFLPHIGELNFKQKALYLGYIVNRMLRVSRGIEKPTDRDSFLYKRVEVSGMLIYELFREYYTLQQRNIFLKLDSEYFYNKTTPKYKEANFMDLIQENVPLIFGDRIVEKGFRKAFKGDWGAESHTKRPGVLQDLSRLSYWSFMAQLRKTNVNISAEGAKVVGPRLLNSTQWGILCPIHTPDGGNIGFHKHLSAFTKITPSLSGYPFITLLRTMGITLLEEASIDFLSKTTKIFVNGSWIGATDNIISMYNSLKLMRRNGLFSPFISIRWNITRNELLIQTDAGRPCHPVMPVHGDKISYQTEDIMDKIQNNSLTWDESILGFAKKTKETDVNSSKIYTMQELYGRDIDLEKNQAIIEYLDTQEMEGVKLASYDQPQSTYKDNYITHIEIHPSVILSVMANQIIFPSHNQFPRDSFSCGQSKQAVSVFHTNAQNRMDKTSYFLNYGQIPLVKSRYLDYATKEQHPYGVNAIVAVMCYSGYNVEDAVIFNKSALDRGIFRTTYISTYEGKEEKTKVGNVSIDKNFMDVNNFNVVGKKPGYDYSQLDAASGLIKENSQVNDKTILMGMATNSMASSSAFIDESKAAKKGTIGYIDKSFMTRDEAGGRIAKVRLRHVRIPAIGDKFASRAGQKGTIGIVLPESDMPYTADGIRPDIIVNPHAFPSRMTIGHLVESLTGKACSLYGGFGDCTAFVNKGPKDKLFGGLLTKAGYNSTGNEIMYNGMTGEQLETEIYIGPTYYMRLKHMVKDKINYRARGPRTVLTRQTVQGRANDGGLRIGEMDRDAVIAHGLAGFLNESMMVRGDQYKMAICNKSGTIAVYNASKNIFLSPMVDGPLKFTGNLENELNIVNISRFGRDFSIVNVPYAFKLLYQELLTMNVQMRFITADNVDQLTSLTKTENIKLITGEDDLQGVEKLINEKLNQTEENYGELVDNLRDVATETPEPERNDYTLQYPEQTFYPAAEDTSTQSSPIYGPNSPDYDPYNPEHTPISPGVDTYFPAPIITPPLTGSYVFKKTRRTLSAGDKVTFINAKQNGYKSDAMFTISWIDPDSFDASIEGPDGKTFIAYIGELGDVPQMNSSTSIPINPTMTAPSQSLSPNVLGSDILNKTVTDPQTVQATAAQPTIIYDTNNPAVTVTETKTVTGPPEYVLANKQQINAPQELEEINEKVNNIDASSIPEQSESAMAAESKVIRRIKEIDDSNKNTTPLLANVEQESTDKDDEDAGQTKKVNTV